MKATVVWEEKINIPDNGDNCVYDLCFSPDGSLMIAAVGLRVLVINVAEGSVVQALKGHKSTVYCAAYASDGKRFATGGADKTCIIWTNNLQGALKYVHGDSIQCVAYNPVTHQLASCAVSDFGLWSPEKKSVDKHKVPARINVCAWTSDGSLLALGLANGIVSLRTKAGNETGRIERPGGSNSGIWGLAFAKGTDENSSGQGILCVGDWGQVLSFYNLSTKQVGKERNLGFDPTRIICANYNEECEYLIITGANKACAIYTIDGVKVSSVAEQDSWIWTVATKPGTTNGMAVGTQGGLITYYEVQLHIVHALYKALYAYRMNMTDVMVQNLLHDTRIRIKCRDVVKKLAIYKDSLAIQFTDRVLIYQREENSDEFKYVLKEKIAQSFDCSLLVMCSENLVLCLEKKLSSYSFQGVKVREWNLDSPIRYIRTVGGMKGREVLVAGLKNGQVTKIFIDNPFPCDVVKVPQSVRCVDINVTHTKVAVVDESSVLFVYDLETGELVFQEPSAVSVFWNTYCGDLLSFSGYGVLNIKADGFPIHQQKMDGFVVGFCGSKLFSMQSSTVVTLEVPLTTQMYQYLQNKMFKEAYKIALLGVPLTDWDKLGNAALEGEDFEIAKKSYAKTRNLQILRLLHNYEQDKGGEMDEGKALKIFLAEVNAHRGEFQEAARLFRAAGEDHRAMAMYADLRMFDMAQDFLASGTKNDKDETGGGGDLGKGRMELMKMKADWAVKINEPRAAAEMYLVAGEKLKAIDLMGQNEWTDMLLDVGLKLERTDGDSLAACARYLLKLGQVSAAAEMYRRIGLYDKVLELYVIKKDWQEAFLVAEKHPELKRFAYLPYAQWLAENDQFTESQKAFHEAGCPEAAFKVLEQLRRNAVEETRYHDAGYYHWVLSMQYLELAKKESDETEQSRHLEIFWLHQKKAGMYYAYNSIYRYTDQPFTPFMADALFNISRFLMHELMTETDLPISKFHILYTLAKQARTLEAYKLSRHVLERLRGVMVPECLKEGLQCLTISSKGDNFTDNEELLPMCYRCSTTNPLLNPRGNYCVNCYHPFIFSFVSFEILPLVEFQLEEGLSDEEAIGLIGSMKASTRDEEEPEGGRWKEEKIESGEATAADVLTLDEDGDDIYYANESQLSGRFSSKGMNEDGEVGSVVVGRAILRTMEPTEVVVLKWPEPLRYQFFRNLIPDMSISHCQACFKVFHTDDFVLQVLQKGHCPFCRTPANNSLGSFHNE